MAKRSWFLGRVVTPTEVIEEGALGITEEKIHYVGSAEEAARDPRDSVEEVAGWITPGMIDLHVHGAGGRSLMEGTPEAIAQVSRTLAAHGTTGYLATDVVSREMTDNRHLEVAAELTGVTPEDGAEILGIHVEGPYVNESRAGLIRKDRIWPPDRKNLEGLLKLMQGKLRMMTLAPELPGALELMAPLKDHGAIGSLGHTEASFDEARAGFGNGIRHVTHLYNAMRGLHHREPGALGAVLVDHGVTTQLITDGVHVHPELLRWTARVLSPEALVLITDALPSAGLPDGQYNFDGRPYVAREGTAWSAEPDDNNRLFGTALLQDDLLRRAMTFMKLSFTEVVAMATVHPAKTLGLEKEVGLLAAGRQANLVLWDETFQVQQTFLRGKRIFSRENNPVESSS